jgi:hypothetical protein
MIEFFASSTSAASQPASQPTSQPAFRQRSGYVPLQEVVKPMLTTAEAAFYLNRQPQTLRIWACRDEGPIRPVRLHGRLGWPLAEIRRYLSPVVRPAQSAGEFRTAQPVNAREQ